MDPDIRLARSGLWTNCPKMKEGHRKWAEDLWEQDPASPMKEVYHPEVRLRWAELMMQQAIAELSIVMTQPEYDPDTEGWGGV